MRSLLLLLFSCSTSLLYAQFNFGVKAGIQSNTIKLDDGNQSGSMSGIGYHVGITPQLTFAKKFIIQPNVLFVCKTVKPNSDTTVMHRTIDLPINFLYQSREGFFVGAGPVFSYGLQSHVETPAETIDFYEPRPGHTKATLKRLEIGLNFIAGYRLKNNIVISGHVNPGITNLADERDNGERYSTTVLGLSIGYLFGK